MFIGPQSAQNVQLFGAAPKQLPITCNIPQQSPPARESGVQKTELVKVDLACGQRKKEGHIGVDIVAIDGVDIVHDLEKFPWPFGDESVDEVNCEHYIEHTRDLMQFMNELYRIMKPGGKASFLCPYYNSMRAWQDPTHTRAISEATFVYFNKGWREAEHLDHYPIYCDFDYSYAYTFFPDWQSRSEEAKQFAIKHYTNVVADIIVHMTKKGSIKDLAK